MTLTDNSNPLDGGAFALNNEGVAEDDIIQLGGGAHSLQAQYAGDNSFTASSATRAITVAAATTSTTSVGPGSVTVGSSANLTATVTAQSFGSAPSGTFTFQDNGTPIAGTISYVPEVPCGNQFYVCLQGSLSHVFSTSGDHNISVSYSGGSDYAASSAMPLVIHAYYQPTMSVTATPANPAAGATVTLTAVVDTTAKNLAPTGTVTFYNADTSDALPGSVTLTPTTDGNGNSALQATLQAVPPRNHFNFRASYSGDSNFGAVSTGSSSITVAGSDFSVFSDPSVGVSRGSTGAIGILIDGQASYSGTINFSPSSCSGLPSESSCSFGTPSITGSGSLLMNIATTAPHTVAGRRYRSGSLRLAFWLYTGGAGVFGLFMLPASSSRKRQTLLMLSFVLLAITLPIAGCGGGSSGGGGPGPQTDPGTPTGAYTVTVTASDGTTSHTAMFTLNVQ